MVYKPAEDTYFLLDAIKDIKGKVMELGCGSCYVLSNIKASFKVGCDLYKPDLNKNDIEFVLADCKNAPFRANSFDYVIFNPPYLPSEHIIDIAVDGGKGGIEIPLQFLRTGLRLVKEKGKIYFIISSLSDYETLEQFLKKSGLKYIKKEKRLFYETLYLYLVDLS